MADDLTRRRFLETTLAAPLTRAVLPATIGNTSDDQRYSVLLLRDVHFDRLAHHDMTWLSREKPNDLRQVQNYARLTADVWPRTLARLRARVDEGRSPRVAFIAQVGDLIEGLCGTPALAEIQAEEALASIRVARLGAPFLFCKGNHDITGPGAPEVFDRVLQPFVRGQAETIARSVILDAERACLAVAYGADWFLFFDAYDEARSLDWLHRMLARRTARHVFLFVHPPGVPYGARSIWIVYAKADEQANRQRFLNLLGEHRVFLLTGHIHRYAVVTRMTGLGPFVHIALSSVIADPALTPPSRSARASRTPSPSSFLTGVQAYTPDQIAVEPAFSPATEADRRAVLTRESSSIRAFEYGDVPGYAAVSIDADTVCADLYAGLATQPWRTLDLVSWRDWPHSQPSSRR